MLTKVRVVAVPTKDTQRETFRLDGWLGRERIRLALRTERKADALRIAHKIEIALAEGRSSGLWTELKERLPQITFEKFANYIGWQQQPKEAESPKPTWEQLRASYEARLVREIAKGNLRASTRERYLQTLVNFDRFLELSKIALLSEITQPLVETWKIQRIEDIKRKPISRGGTGYVLDTAILRATFNHGVSEKLIAENPVKSEGRPGARPTNGASPFTPAELSRIMEHAGGDRLAILVLFRTGLRRSDAFGLRWKHIDFENEQINIVALKNNKRVRVPILPDLLEGLKNEKTRRCPSPDDQVLHNPNTSRPFFRASKLYERCRAVGKRASVENVRPHRFRDSFAADAFLRGCDTEEVAAYLGDTVATVAAHYSEFIEERRKRADAKMRTGKGLVEFRGSQQPTPKPKLQVIRRRA